MYIIRPTTITDALFVSSDVPETDYNEYAAGTTYGDGDTVIESASGVHKIYESLKAANTGNYPPDNCSGADPWWLEVGATNRWKPFDAKVGSQASQTTSMTFVIAPGLLDAVAVLNMDATGLRVTSADQNTDLVTNGSDWTGATGTTQPTGWDKVGTPSDFLIDAGALKMTVDANGEGISQTNAVVAETEMQLLFKYRNTAGDLAQIAIYDVTNGADILATTDLASSVTERTGSHIFTVPAGCASLKISLLGKTAGDIVWFDDVKLMDVVYDESIDLVSTVGIIDGYTYCFEPIIRKTDIVKLDLPPYSTETLTVTVTYTGGTAKCGEIVVGLKRDIGITLNNPAVGITDYSIKEADAWGNYSIVERSYAKRMSCNLRLANALVDEVNRVLSLYRSTPIVWVGSEDFTSLIVYGFFKDFEITIPYPNYSDCSLEIEGLT